MSSGALVDQKPFFASAIIDVPLDLAVLRVERDQVRVGRRQEDGVLVDGGAAVADVEALVGRIGVAPDLARRCARRSPRCCPAW